MKLLRSNIVFLQIITFIAIAFIMIFQGYILYTYYNSQHTAFEKRIERIMKVSILHYQDIMLRTSGGSLEVTIDFDETKEDLENKDITIEAGMQKAYRELLNFYRYRQPLLDSILVKKLNAQSIDLNYRILLHEDGNPRHSKGVHYAPYYYSTDWITLDDCRRLKLSYANPVASVLKQMISLLILSTLLLAVVIGSLIYQLGVLFRQKRLEEARKNFVDSMTHELRHPLQGALSMVELMNNPDFIQDTNRQRHALNRAIKNLRSLGSMIDSLAQRSFSEEIDQKANWKPNILSSDVDHIVTTFQHIKEKEVYIETIYGSSQGKTFYYDPIHLPNAIKNIIDNSIKYSGPHIHIKILISYTSEIIKITIKDNGYGIANSEMNNIFEKYYRIKVHNTKHGFGLGLSYVKWVCDIHDGTVSVTSELGHGSCFTIKIPNHEVM